MSIIFFVILHEPITSFVKNLTTFKIIPSNVVFQEISVWIAVIHQLDCVLNANCLHYVNSLSGGEEDIYIGYT